MPDLMTADGLRRFDAVVATHVADDKVPGLVALVALGGQAHVAALGSLTVGGAPVQRDSLFRIASVVGLALGVQPDPGLGASGCRTLQQVEHVPGLFLGFVHPDNVPGPECKELAIAI
jgi:hypothetical protein